MRRRSSPGFTLIELMVVICIIGILLSILLPNMVRSKWQAQWTSCCQNEQNLAIACESYNTQEGTYPTNLNVLPVSSPGTPYIGVVPTCPSNGLSYTLGYGVASSTGSLNVYDSFTISCPGSHYVVLANVVVGFPQYTPSKGLNEYDSTH